MAITIRHPRSDSRNAFMLAAAVVLTGALSYGAYTVVDNVGSGGSQPTGAVSSTAETDVRGSTGGVAEWANENGLSGSSPASLRLVEGAQSQTRPTTIDPVMQGSGVSGVSVLEYLPGNGHPLAEVNPQARPTSFEPVFSQGSGASGVSILDQLPGNSHPLAEINEIAWEPRSTPYETPASGPR